MSLKAVHIVFITASTLLAFGFGAWSINLYRADGGSSYLLMGVLSIIIGVVLIVYGKQFLQKLKHVGYM